MRWLLDATDALTARILARRGFQRRFVPTSVGRVHVFDGAGSGDGPPVVVLHGISAAGVSLAPVIAGLRRHHRRVIAPDMPGHGFSDVPAGGLAAPSLQAGLFEALDAVIDEPVVFFGNSLGGIGAIRYASARPDRVRSLVLCSPGGARLEPEALQRFLDAFRMPTHGDAVSFVDRVHARSPWYGRLIASGVRARFHALRGFIDQITADDLLAPEDLAGLPVPTLLVWGKQDRLMSREMFEFFRTNLPAGTAIDEPEGLGHCPHLDDPGRLVDIIAGFGRRVGGAGGG